MEIRGGLLQQGPGMAPVSFSDVAACFSDEEWKLLQGWQKELYKSVMKELHQAVTSLGPLIATSIFSIKPRKRDELQLKDPQDFKIRSFCEYYSRPTLDASSSDDDDRDSFLLDPKDSERSTGLGGVRESACNAPVVPFTIKEEAEEFCFTACRDLGTREDPIIPAAPEANTQIVSFVIKDDGMTRSVDLQESESRDRIRRCPGVQPLHAKEEGAPGVPSECIQLRQPGPLKPRELNALARLVIVQPDEETASVFNDHLGEKARRSSSDPISGHEIISFCIKEEEETCCVDYPARKMVTSVGSLAGEESGNNRRATGYCLAGSEKATESEDVMGTGKRMGLKGCEKATNSVTRLWPGSKSDLGRRTNLYDGGQPPPEHFKHHPGASILQRSEGCMDLGSSLWNESLLTSHQNPKINPQLNVRRYSCTECVKSFKTKTELTRHQRTHSGERPYHCTLCGNRFSLRHHLIGHQRTHTGERPYQCVECKKRFTFKGNLKKHQRTHLAKFKPAPL
ncbi:uncharacterized protein LOC144767887 [Lissotriton helveticus]